jgi:hypothetical protein
MSKSMGIAPCQLSRFSELDNKLTLLKARGATSAELWQAFSCLALLGAPSFTEADRRCWWQHLYAILERHGLAVARATVRA